MKIPYIGLKPLRGCFYAACFAALAVNAILSPASLAQTGVPASTPRETLPPADAIVVGAGIAGLSAAWELAQGGAKVVVVDMASVFGGHAVMASGDLCIVGTPDQVAKGLKDTPDLAYGDFVAWGEDPSPEWVRYYVDHSRREIYDWVASMGVTFARLLEVPGNSVMRLHRTKGKGLALVTPIYQACLADPNITFVWDTRVDRLLVTDQRIAGVAATHVRTGAASEIRGRAAVLATGGFQSNLDLVRESWPKGLNFPRNFLIGSGINSVGSGLGLAQKAGAALARMDHQWNYVTGLPDPRFPGSQRGLNADNNYAIWVNAEGRRFVAEKTSAKYSMQILVEQPGETYWSVFDQSTKSSYQVAGTGWGDFREIEKWIFSNPALVKSADTLEALAAQTGLPAEALKQTVRRFNEMVDKGVDEEFGRFGPEMPTGRQARMQRPVAARQPKKIATPPFYAVQQYPLTRKSMGGVAIDTACRVQDTAGKTIPGLYAAGEVTGLAGINGKAGLEGTFLGPSIVTGRVAGRTVLEDQGRKAGSGRVSPPPIAPTIKPDPLATTSLCLSCHDLPKLVAEKRPGFWHFDKVHHEVVAARRDCTQCHAELTPTYFPETHRINRLAQVQTCVTCHQGEDR